MPKEYVFQIEIKKYNELRVNMLRILLLIIFLVLLGGAIYAYNSEASKQGVLDCGECECCKVSYTEIRCQSEYPVEENADLEQLSEEQITLMCTDVGCSDPVRYVVCENEADRLLVRLRNGYNQLLEKTR